MDRTTSSDDGIGRRALLGRAGLGAALTAAAWVAPSIVSQPAAAAATTPCPGCGPTNLLTNGDFEVGDLVSGIQYDAPPWFGITGPTPTAFAVRYADAPLFLLPTPPPGQTGSSGFLYLQNDSASQDVTLSPLCAGHGYTLSAWAWTDSTSTGRLQLDFYDQAQNLLASPSIDLLTSSPAGSWQQFTLPGTVPSGATLVTVSPFGLTGGIGVDLVSLTITC